jgi:hypothetical protein
MHGFESEIASLGWVGISCLDMANFERRRGRWQRYFRMGKEGSRSQSPEWCSNCFRGQLSILKKLELQSLHDTLHCDRACNNVVNYAVLFFRILLRIRDCWFIIQFVVLFLRSVGTWPLKCGNRNVQKTFLTVDQSVTRPSSDTDTKSPFTTCRIFSSTSMLLSCGESTRTTKRSEVLADTP